MPSPTFSFALKTIYALLLTLALSCAAQAQTFTLLHTFNGKNGDGPEGVLTLDAAGNIYGTTAGGGTGKCSQFGCGTGFMLNKAGKQEGVYSFGGMNGYGPVAGLLRDAMGNFFGTTVYGGDTNCDPPYGCGTVLKVSKTAKETVLHKFTGPPDGWFPESLLVEDAEGDIYGTTYLGGSGGNGAVFKIDATGKETILYNFIGGPDGCFPGPGVVLDSIGNLYGVTSLGGVGFCNSGYGVVFKIDTTGNETVLHAFGGGDGANPDSVLLFDSKGNLYGTTENGGNSECGGTGCGVVFELLPQQGGSWSEATLYQFCSLLGCLDGEEPGIGPLVRDSAGNIYGTTYFGGAQGDGVVFELDAAGKETVLHSFTAGADGANPVAGLAIDVSGDLYGTAKNGGATCYVSYTCGVVFKIEH
jgi:uncharacterized repeat protein (TIGR03803 family)